MIESATPSENIKNQRILKLWDLYYLNVGLIMFYRSRLNYNNFIIFFLVKRNTHGTHLTCYFKLCEKKIQVLTNKDWFNLHSEDLKPKKWVRGRLKQSCFMFFKISVVLFHRPEFKASKGECSSHWEMNLRFFSGFRTSYFLIGISIGNYCKFNIFFLFCYFICIKIQW